MLHQHQQPSPIGGLGLRLPAGQVPAIAWSPWQVVERAKGFHVSRESGGGTRTEFLLNDVGRAKIFRSRALAEQACAGANFGARAEQLKREPLLGGKGGAA